MDSTPPDISRPRLKRRLRGYEREQVDALLARLGAAQTEAAREQERLRERVGELEAAVARFRRDEQAIAGALVLAQREAEQIRARTRSEADAGARLEADQLVSEAHAEAAEIVADAQRERDRLDEEVRRLQEFEKELRASAQTLLGAALAGFGAGTRAAEPGEVSVPAEPAEMSVPAEPEPPPAASVEETSPASDIPSADPAPPFVEPEPPPVRDETAEFATLAGGPGAAAVEEEITLRPPPRAPSRTPQPRTRAEGRRYRTAASIVASVIALAVGGVLIFMAATSRDLPFLSDEADVANASEPGEGTDDGGAVEPAEPPPPGETPTETAPAAPAPSTETVSVLAAGDIAECGPQSGDELTAEILGAHPDATILTLGDNAYPDGTEEEFAACYEPSWGRYKDRTRPASGNHDHHTKDAAGFAAYFGEAAGPFDKYYYSYDLGAWHLVVLNSDCWRVGGCESDDEQIEWLRQDIADHPTACTLAYFHRPPFSSGRYGDLEDTARVQPLWQALHEEGVDVVLTGHEHSYERFAPMDDNGQRDEASGIRLFIVGTGGGNLRKYTRPLRPTTEMRQGDTWGVLELTLRPDGYDWEFLPVKGGTFQDSGSGACH